MSFLLFDMEFIGKVFKFHLVPFCYFFFSTLSPGWPPEEITKSYKGNLSEKNVWSTLGKNTVKKMLVLQFYSLNFSMLDVDCFDFAYPA